MPRPYNNNFNKFEHNFCENNMLNKKIMLIDLKPSDFLMDGHNYDLEVYKSIYYRNSKDKFKIDLFMNKKGGEK